MSDKKTKQDGDSLVKKLLSSNLTWSVVALIVLIVICTISDHQFLSLSWNKNTGGLSGPLITMLQESARYLMIATGMTLVISTWTRKISCYLCCFFGGCHWLPRRMKYQERPYNRTLLHSREAGR